MAKAYFEQQVFDGIDFAEKSPEPGDYEQCLFNSCRFQNVALSGMKFMECRFEECDLSLAGLQGASFQEVVFKNCKMLGLHFEDCNAFNLSFRFEQCTLDHSVFYQCRLPGLHSKNSRMQDTDWSECDLGGAVFEDCDLSNAKFDHTNLEHADLRGARNFRIDPTLNRLRKARFSIEGLPGLLTQYDIRVE